MINLSNIMVQTQLGDEEDVPPLATVSGTVVKEGTWGIYSISWVFEEKQVLSYQLSSFSTPYTFSGIVAKEWTTEVFSEQYFSPILIFRCWPHFVNSDNTTEKMQDWSTRGAKEKFQKSDKTKPFPFLLSTNETSRRRINFFSKIVTTQGPSHFS